MQVVFLGVFLFQGLEKSPRLSGTFVVQLLQPPAWPALPTGLTDVTGLTGAGHRSDRCSTGSKPCKFPLCVLVCFGSEGCLLVPRSSGTPVSTWTCPTWVVSRRRVLEAVFVLLESPSPSRRIFIGSHSLPPSLVCRIGPSWRWHVGLSQFLLEWNLLPWIIRAHKLAPKKS
jgi:hypothetical protein